ncbi:MAG: DUF87 domain-containing protein [Lachnospiraceae bacterium]|nr:DUF87 domain-containing protein [Lachnospiraceae bacterium]
MRVIPKRTRVRMELFNGIEVIDVIIAAIGGILVVSLAVSNLPGRFAFAIAALILTVGLVFPLEDDKGYLLLLYALRYFGRPRVFKRKEETKKGLSIEEITPFTGIDGEFIEYGKDYNAVVIEVPSVEFRFYTEMRQDAMIDRVFGGIIRTAAMDETINLVKLDRPIVYDSYIEGEQRRIEELKEAYLNGILNKEELMVRIEIIEDRIADLERINTRDKVYVPFHYLMFMYKDRDFLRTQAKQTIETLAANNMICHQLKDKELALFLKYNYGMAFEEREVENLKPDEYMDWILPKEIRFSARMVQYDGLITHNLRIRDYPVLVGNAWAAQMFNTVGSKVVFKLKPVERGKAIRQIDRSLEELRDQMGNTAKASRILDIDTQISALADVLRALQGENETLFNVNAFLQINDYDLSEKRRNQLYKSSERELYSMRKEARQKLAEEGFRTTEMFLEQFEAYSSSSLSAYDAFEQYERGIHSSSIAAAFPFVFKNLQDDDGIFIGRSGGVPVFIDFFRRDSERVNSNTVIIGKSGSGKSYATKTLLAQLAAEDSKIFVLDPENEYTKMARNLNGKVIDVGTATEGRLNPFHIITSLSDDEDEESKVSTVNSYSAHLQFLEEFFRQILPGIAPESFDYLNNLINAMYNKMGIDNNTDLSKLKASDYPTFQDLYDEILEAFQTNISDNDYTRGILRGLTAAISKFAEGGRDSLLWNGEATISTEENFVVFDFQTLLSNKNAMIANAQMLLVLKWLDNEIIKNREYNMYYHANRKIVIVIDEAHVFIDDKHPIALDFMFQLAKRIRKYNGMQIVITQNIKDFVGTEELARKSTAIINASQYSFIFPLSPNDMTDLIKLYENAGAINESEQDDIVNNGRGRAFVITSPGERTNVDIEAGEGIEEMFSMT